MGWTDELHWLRRSRKRTHLCSRKRTHRGDRDLRSSAGTAAARERERRPSRPAPARRPRGRPRRACGRPVDLPADPTKILTIDILRSTSLDVLLLLRPPRTRGSPRPRRSRPGAAPDEKQVAPRGPIWRGACFGPGGTQGWSGARSPDRGPRARGGRQEPGKDGNPARRGARGPGSGRRRRR